MASTDDFTRNGDDGATAARDALGNVVREVKKLNSTLFDDARTRTDKVAKMVDKNGRAALSNLQHTVQEKPALAVGLAVGTGVILGMLFSSRR